MTFVPSIVIYYGISIVVGAQGVSSRGIRGLVSGQHRFVLEDGKHSRKDSFTFPSSSPTEKPQKYHKQLDSNSPSEHPTDIPSWEPTSDPTSIPSTPPSEKTQNYQKRVDSNAPSEQHTGIPSWEPTLYLTPSPSRAPTFYPRISHTNIQQITGYPTKSYSSKTPLESDTDLNPSHETTKKVTQVPTTKIPTLFPSTILDHESQGVFPSSALSSGNVLEHIESLPPNPIGNTAANTETDVEGNNTDTTNGAYNIGFENDLSAKSGNDIGPLEITLISIFGSCIVIAFLCGICVRVSDQRKMKENEIDEMCSDTQGITVLPEQTKNFDISDEVTLEKCLSDGAKKSLVGGEQDNNVDIKNNGEKDTMNQELKVKERTEIQIVEERLESISKRESLREKIYFDVELEQQVLTETDIVEHCHSLKETPAEGIILGRSVLRANSAKSLINEMKENDREEQSKISLQMGSTPDELSECQALDNSRETSQIDRDLTSHSNGDIVQLMMEEDDRHARHTCGRRNSNSEAECREEYKCLRNNSKTELEERGAERGKENDVRHDDDDIGTISSEDLEYMYGTLPMDKLPSTPRTSNCNRPAEDEFRVSPQSRSVPRIPFGRGPSFVQARYSNLLKQGGSDNGVDDTDNYEESLYWV
eukprot:CAMPEP_0172403808 /NCGR_PEP_ID=MMETSP1061-20121228/60568_1 /TAXON_ID=37318 /ORGANISM="Pseudo-nitzschia pungens, Strain cf. pungens" /LENGTH=646 /DNA_ID=CAMNT_0013138335 /DNA_START=84 /DNA_END=2024 /DNA_ORIENTATION=-